MRIVSLLPSATEIVYALGLDEQLAAVTHECDYPYEAARKPVITASVVKHELRESAEIDDNISALVKDRKSIYTLDERLLRDLEPDIILTQELCDVCAVSYGVVEKAARILEGATDIISLEPSSISDVFANILLIGRKTGTEAQELIAGYSERIDFIRERVSGMQVRPLVYCMEWLDPPFSAGHWVPEMVSIAGGRECLGVEGRPSQRIPWRRIVEAAPEVFIFMPCGFDLEQTVENAPAVYAAPDWHEIPAVRRGNVFAVDGSGYFNRPGPRLVEGLEILAELIHPQEFQFGFAGRSYKKL